MLAAARRGVTVSLIVDAFGSDAAEHEHFFAPLEAAGASVCEFEPRFGRRYLLRNHQKLALADAEEEPRVIIGGFNSDDDYFRTRAEGAWRALGLLVERPAAERIAGYFDALSGAVRQPHGSFCALRTTPNPFTEETGALRPVIPGAPRPA